MVAFDKKKIKYGINDKSCNSPDIIDGKGSKMNAFLKLPECIYTKLNEVK